MTSESQPQKLEQSNRPPPQPRHQQWLPPMQYPAAAMVMQHHQMMPLPHHFGVAPLPPLAPQQFFPFHQYQHHQANAAPPPHPQQQSQGQNNGENKTIWVGDLHHWMDESYLHSCFATAGEIASIKVIRNKQTGFSEGYGFVEFFTHATADGVLQKYSTLTMPNTEQPFRLNWATFSMGEKRSENGPDLSIFVGDLAADVTDTLLLETFAKSYPSVKGAKVVIDVNTGRSKGYGFVRFGDDSDRTKAMTEMNGTLCSARPMRIGAATPRKSSGYQQSPQGGYPPHAQAEGDSSNATIFVGGLDPDVTDGELRQSFSQYGEIVSVKIPAGRGCGFVQFSNRNDAEEALHKLNGAKIGKQTVRLSWGRNNGNKQVRGDFGNQWSGVYYGGNVYDGYGYAFPPPHDPSMYAATAAAAAYGGYPIYSNHQQQTVQRGEDFSC